MNNGIFGSNIYALNPINDLPVARWKKKSMFQSFKEHNRDGQHADEQRVLQPERGHERQQSDI